MENIDRKRILRRTKRTFKEKIKKYNKTFELDNYFKDLIGDKKEVYIADLGAGMVSTTGSKWKNIIIHLYPSDFLIDRYDKLLEKTGLKLLIPIEYQDMEKLDYKNNFFDIVHCVNALDHTENPKKALAEMIRVCKKDGFIYLRHCINTGETERYSGLHQWNISEENNDCVFWNKQKRFLLSEYGNFNTKIESNLIVSILCKI